MGICSKLLLMTLEYYSACFKNAKPTFEDTNNTTATDTYQDTETKSTRASDVVGDEATTVTETAIFNPMSTVSENTATESDNLQSDDYMGEKNAEKDLPAFEGDTSNRSESEQETESTTEQSYRQTQPGPKKFNIQIKSEKWNKIKPTSGSHKLKTSWTHVLYSGFRKYNHCCALTFKYNHLKTPKSRKKSSPYLKVKANCMFSSCKATYIFEIPNRPSHKDKKITVHVSRTGNVQHRSDETRARPASNKKRGKIAKAVAGGVSNAYYHRLGNTPLIEQIAGNLSHSLSKDILKAVSAELNKSTRLHDDMLMELIITQQIMRESDTDFVLCPGYIQHLQVDPFGVHLYTEKGIALTVEHLRQSSQVTLFLDATGGVVRRLHNQNKRVLYYALCLSGDGKNKPLPVCEMITNDHTVANISFWLMKFLSKVRRITAHKIGEVETDYSWALMQGVLLAFDRIF